MPYDSREFYQRMEGFSAFFEFSRPQHYHSLPDDWLVVVTDIVDSTEAIQAGRYKEVNAVGVASIVALTNALSPLSIPYVFGGDGITACVPGALRAESVTALAATRRMAGQRFGLELRVGLVPMADIGAAGYRVLIGKFRPHAEFQQAMFLGRGLRHAERLIKDGGTDNPYRVDNDERAVAGEADFSGFECRWREIPSPAEENIALLVEFIGDGDGNGGSDGAERERVYTEVLGEIDRIYGMETQYHPLREDNLSLSMSFRVLSVEADIRTAFRSPWRRWLYLLKLQALRWVGTCLMRCGLQAAGADWGRYKHQVILNTDYRKFDEVLRMVIAGDRGQRLELRRVLDEYRQEGQLVFGIHSAPAALMTCMVADYGSDHVHFLDAADGGYAMASKEMKQQRSG